MKIKYLLSLSLVCLFAVNTAQAQGLWGSTSTGSQPESLFTIDPATGTATLVGSLGLGDKVPTLTFHPTTGVLYGISGSATSGAELVTIDPATAIPTVIGTVAGAGFDANASGNGVGSLAFAQDGTLYGGGWAAGSGRLLVIDPATAVVSAAYPTTGGAHLSGLEFDSVGTLWATRGGNDYGTLHTIDTSNGATLTTLNLQEAVSVSGIAFDSQDTMYANIHREGQLAIIDTSNGGIIRIGPFGEGLQMSGLTSGDFTGDPIALFRVTKFYTDGHEADVEVTLTCNGGLPLSQSFTLDGGDASVVTFTVTELPEAGVTCEVTETSEVENYTPSYDNGSVVSETSCIYTDVSTGYRTCAITNTPADAEYTVTAVWELDGPDAVAMDDAEVHIVCDEDNGGDFNNNLNVWVVTTYLDDGESETVSVDTSNGEAECWAVPQEVEVSGVSIFNGCSPTLLSAAEEESCEITYTLFFEGIPTLSQYGMALMALLMLGVGMVGFRRFS